MKKNLTISTVCFVMAYLMTSVTLFAQEKASPAKTSKATVNGNTLTINYSSPSKKGRDIYGGLVPFGAVWRTGANEATTIELSKDANIGGVDVKAGKYSLFTIPGEKEWSVIINSNPKQWGAYSYDKSQDVGRFTAASSNLDQVAESFTINVSDQGVVSLVWDKTKVEFTVK